MLKLQPTQHALNYFEDLLRIQRVPHQLYNLKVSQDSHLIEKVDYWLNLPQDSRMCGVS